MTTVSTPASLAQPPHAHADVDHRLVEAEVGAVAAVARVPAEEADAPLGDELGEVVLGEVDLVVRGDERHRRPLPGRAVVEALAGASTGSGAGHRGRLGRHELALDGSHGQERYSGAMKEQNTQFRIRGVNHLALVCRDMERTVDFYTNVLGMPLIKTIEFPDGAGQHFFFDIGNGDSLAFFWFPNAPEPAPGISSAKALPGQGELTTAIGSMNHIAFDVPAEEIENYQRRLVERGIECSTVVNHDRSQRGVTKEMTDDVFIRSVYFFDPDGILLEFACWTGELTDADVSHAPARALTAPVGG